MPSSLQPIDELETRVRMAAFRLVEELTSVHSGHLPRKELERGFILDGVRVPLVGPQGIFKPATLRLPLSITTKPVAEGEPRPYDDQIRSDGLMHYRYRGKDPMHRDNVGLRSAMQHRTPLIYFHGIVPGIYVAVWPVFVVGDDKDALTFLVQFENPAASVGDPAETIAELQRAYTTVLVQHRLHQEAFRYRVIRAYREACAVCALRHRELLDAAHIVADRDPAGEPWVRNGLSLCKLHHAAFDAHLIGIRSDYVVEVREAVLKESDGPMLRHGLQECHQQRLLVLPTARSQKPDPELLGLRYERFREAG